MGKIFKALEKSQQSVEPVENVADTFDSETLSDVHGLDTYGKAEPDDTSLNEIIPDKLTHDIDPILITGLNRSQWKQNNFGS